MAHSQLRIDLCSTQEVPLLCEYLRNYWAADHVLAADRPLLDWQHFDPTSGKYNYAVAWSEGETLPAGVLGFIPTSRYDAELRDRNTLWLALWSVRTDLNVGGLGIRLLNFVLGLQAHEAVGTLGISKATETLMRAYGCQSGLMNHHYMPADHRKNFSIMTPAIAATAPSDRTSVSLDLLTREGVEQMQSQLPLESLTSRKPVKTAAYFANRYFAHPSFTYSVWALRKGPSIVGLMALRAVNANGSKALRIVDYLGAGDGFVGSYDALQKLLRDEDAEYVDLMNYGLSEERMDQSGFLLKDPDGEVVVPDYFEPFEPRNVAKRFVFRPPSGEDFVLFKADADQDRPNFPVDREGDTTREES